METEQEVRRRIAEALRAAEPEDYGFGECDAAGMMDNIADAIEAGLGGETDGNSVG